MDVKLQAKIKANPTNTLLQNTNLQTKHEFIKVPKYKFTQTKILPANFNGIEVWKGMITPPLNQGTCGSCWAFASVSCLADRFNILSKGKYNITLSPTKLVLCDWQGSEFDVDHPEKETSKEVKTNKDNNINFGCYGNTLADAWRYLYLLGTPTMECIPYELSEHSNKLLSFQSIGKFTDVRQLPLCEDLSGPLGDMCSNFIVDNVTGKILGTPERFYRSICFYTLYENTPYNIMQEIYHHGPVNTAMDVYSNFYTFNPKTDIYKWDGNGSIISGHAISIVGWGIENGEEFWWIKNSWGTDWGINGYFKMKKGVNECKIEENIITGIPDFFYPADFLIHIASKFGMSPSLIEKRENIDISINFTAGGINPETGYTRRVMTQSPWLDFSPPVSLSLIPDLSSFWAGEIHNFIKLGNNKVHNTLFLFLINFILIILIIIFSII